MAKGIEKLYTMWERHGERQVSTGTKVERLQVQIRGRVQGVGFRYATCGMAREEGLTGWVRNLPSGEVEAEFQGPRDALERALAWCGHGPRLAHVTHLEHSWLEAGPEQNAFKIR